MDNLPGFLSNQHIPGIDIVVDPLSAIMVFIVTWILCAGIKEVNLLYFFIYNYLFMIYDFQLSVLNFLS